MPKLFATIQPMFIMKTSLAVAILFLVSAVTAAPKRLGPDGYGDVIDGDHGPNGCLGGRCRPPFREKREVENIPDLDQDEDDKEDQHDVLYENEVFRKREGPKRIKIKDVTITVKVPKGIALTEEQVLQLVVETLSS